MSILICTFLCAALPEVAFNRAAAFALSRKSKFDASTTKSRGELHREALVRAGTGMDSARLAILQGLLGAAKVAPVAVALQKSHLGAPVAGGAATPSTPGAGAGAGGGIGTSASMSSAGTYLPCVSLLVDAPSSPVTQLLDSMPPSPCCRMVLLHVAVC